MSRINEIIISLIIVIILAGCTHDENPVGYDPMGEPIYLKISGEDAIGNIYSYEDSISNYNNSSIFVIGNWEEYEAMALMKFNGLPDTLWEVRNDSINLVLFIQNQYNNIDNSYKFWGIGENWEEDEVTCMASSDTSGWVNADIFFPADTAIVNSFVGEFSQGDSIIINLTGDFFYSDFGGTLKVDSLLAETGIFIKRDFSDYEDKNFIEFYSYESDSSLQPYLTFNYKSDESDEEYTKFKSTSVEDAMIYRSEDDDLEVFNIFDGELKLRNISPVKMFMEVILSDAKLDTIIIESDNVVNPYNTDFPVTINKAYLTLTAKGDHYSSSSYIYTQPAVMTNSEMTNTPEEIPVYKDDYDLVSGVTTSQDSLHSMGEELIYRIDITSELQKIIIENDEIEGYGLIIRSIRENRDFSYIDFYTCEDNPEKSPYLEVYCTPPIGD